MRAAGRLPVYFRGLSFWSRLTVFCRRIFGDVFFVKNKLRMQRFFMPNCQGPVRPDFPEPAVPSPQSVMSNRLNPRVESAKFFHVKLSESVVLDFSRTCCAFPTILYAEPLRNRRAEPPRSFRVGFDLRIFPFPARTLIFISPLTSASFFA